jgi:hypothetical protein
VIIAFGPRAVCLIVALILLLLSAYSGVSEPTRGVLLRVGLAFMAAAFLFSSGAE